MATLQEIQQVEYEMLQFLHNRCEKLHIRYCMGCGTLLGAVRHQGFIPWDDDLDVYMSMEDFEVFKNGFKSEEFFLQMPENEREYGSVVFKLRKNGTRMRIPARAVLDIHHGIWLDIFVYTNAGKTKLTKKLQVFFLRCLQSFRLKYYHKKTNPNRKVFLMLCKLPFSVSLVIDRMLYDAIKLLGSKNSGQVFTLDIWEHLFFKKEFFEKTCLYPFEGGQFWGIGDYDSYLRQVYGNDYMTPRKWGHVADYSDVIV